MRVKETLAFLDKHRNMARKAIAVGSGKPGDKALPLDEAGAALAELRQFLERYRSGLEEIEDVDHPLHITWADFAYPPFESWIPIDTWHNKKKNLAQDGLIFHLTYLLRYFTCPTLPEHIDARLIDWRLEFYGLMLKGSQKEHGKLVASLVSAVFNKDLSPLHVRTRLKELTIRKVQKGAKHRNPARFTGWFLKADVPAL